MRWAMARSLIMSSSSSATTGLTPGQGGLDAFNEAFLDPDVSPSEVRPEIEHGPDEVQDPCMVSAGGQHSEFRGAELEAFLRIGRILELAHPLEELFAA